MPKAIVIGASSGIGREIAKRLAAEGYAVGITGRREHLLNALREELPVTTWVKRMDLRDVASARSALSELMTQMGGVDLVVISAGIGYVNHELRWDREHETLATNVVGFAAVANVTLEHFIARKAGHLVGISSVAALRGGRYSPAYNASKAFASNLLEGMRQKVTQLGLAIVVTDIKPGFVRTRMAHGAKFWSATAAVAAAQIVNTIKKRCDHAYITRRWRWVAWALRVVPDWVYLRL